MAKKQSLPLDTKRSVVRRGGATQRRWYGETREIKVGTDWEGANKHLNISFSLPCGGGASDVSVRISPADFKSVVKAMIAADPKAALIAMAQHLNLPISR